MSNDLELVIWRYRENQDSEFAEATIDGLDVLAQDCDGDFSRWDVRRGDVYLAAGEISGHEPYHFDAAKERCIIVAKAIVEAEKLNAMADEEREHHTRMAEEEEYYREMERTHR